MLTPAERQPLVDAFRALPEQVAALTSGLTAAQLTTPFLAGEWTVAQNVHHLADSHMNSYVRCKLMATEDRPALKPYDQDRWAEFADAASADLGTSLALLAALHARWVSFWETLPEAAWARTGLHPEAGEVSLEDQLRLYAAHGAGHLDQITRTLAAQAGR